MVRSLFFACLVLFFSSCGGKKADSRLVETYIQPEVPQYPITIPFETGIETEKEVLLSDIADSVRYIRLEISDKSLVESLKRNNLFRTSKYLILPWMDNLYQFDLNGKFIRTIGRRGQGPGEYNWISQVDVNERTNHIFLLNTSAKINIYDLETGKFIRDIKLPNRDIGEMVMFNDTTVISYIRNMNGRQKERLYVTTANGDTLNIYYRNEFFEVKGGMSWMIGSPSDRYMFKYDDLVCSKDYYNDTLFTVSPEALTPRYIFDLGKYSLPLECRFEYLNGDGKTFQNVAAPYIRYEVIEMADQIYISFSNWAGEKSREGQMAIYDKNTGECYKVSGGMIKDDLASGLPIKNPRCSFDNHTLVTVWEVDDIMKEAEKNPAILDYHQLKGLKDDDNPVLMLVYLK